MYDIVDTVDLVLEHCARVARQVCLIGDDADEIAVYVEHLERKGMPFVIAHEPEDFPLFPAFVLLRLSNPEYTFNDAYLRPIYGTVFDVHNLYYKEYQHDRENVEYLSLVNGEFVHNSYCAEFSPGDNDFFLPRIERIFPEARAHRHNMAVIYAGATLDYRLDYIPFEQAVNKILSILDSGIAKIMFWNGDETLQETSVLCCQRICEFLRDRVPPHTFYYFTSGLGSAQVYQQLYKQHGFQYQMHVLSGASFELVTKSNFEKGRDKELHELFLPYDTNPREKKFLCFNRVPRYHRLVLLAHMLERNLVDDAFYSFDIEGHDTDCDEFVNNQLELHSNRFPMVLNRSSERDNPVDLLEDDVKYFKNSYFSVVCETQFHRKGGDMMPNIISSYECVFLSEKIFKPFATKHPFIAVAYPGTLRALRHFGYKTFDPWINEQYDLIDDDEERMLFIVDEIERLCNQTEQQWQDWQLSVKDIVEYNFQWLRQEKDLSYEKTGLEYLGWDNKHE